MAGAVLTGVVPSSYVMLDEPSHVNARPHADLPYPTLDPTPSFSPSIFIIISYNKRFILSNLFYKNNAIKEMCRRLLHEPVH